MPQSSLTRDGFLNKRIWLQQPQQGYRVAIDPVFLAASLPLQPEESVLDCGCGVGAITCFLLSREPRLHVTGIEKNAAVLAIAQQNHERNGFKGAFSPLHGDMATLSLEDRFDHVVSNPPFYPQHGHKKGPFVLKAEAHATSLSLEQWFFQMIKALKDKGRLSVILPPERLGDFLRTAEKDLGHICVFPLWRHDKDVAKRVIIWGHKRTKGSLQILPGLVLHGRNGGYTAEAEAVLRGAALECVR